MKAFVKAPAEVTSVKALIFSASSVEAYMKAFMEASMNAVACFTHESFHEHPREIQVLPEPEPLKT